MKKLSLKLETLEISSFATGASLEGQAGTVQGNAATQITGPCKPTYPYITCVQPCIPPSPY